jgi:RHS repeat-associated protein
MLQVSDGADSQSYAWDGNVAFADGNAYLHDELGSPLRYIDSTGNVIESYGYDEFGCDLYGNQGISQPFGYTGYTADTIAGTYFAQAREYMPQTGRFVSEDLIRGFIEVPFTMNHYTYCWNQPIDFIDLNGMSRAPIGLSRYIVVGHGENHDDVTTESELSDWFREYWGESADFVATFFQIPWTQPQIRDVTDEVNSALNYTAQYAVGRRPDQISFISALLFPMNVGAANRQHIENLHWFYNQVNHSAPWDIKVPERWNDTIGTDFPGRFNTPIYFREQLMTPESLGNWTYGYLGAALGIPLWKLIGGSWYAAAFPMPWTYDFLGNEFLDWAYIIEGFLTFNEENYRCPE